MTAILTECSYNLSLLSNRKISQLTAKTDSRAKILTIGNVVIDFNCIYRPALLKILRKYILASSQWTVSDLNIQQNRVCNYRRVCG